MSGFTIDTLRGASLFLEAASDLPRIDLAVSETHITIHVEAVTDMPHGIVLVAEDARIDLIEVIGAGGTGTPPPIPAPVLISRVDLVSDELAYRAEAVEGTQDTDPAWRVRRIAITEAGEAVVTWAANGEYASAWSDHANLVYAPLEIL